MEEKKKVDVSAILLIIAIVVIIIMGSCLYILYNERNIGLSEEDLIALENSEIAFDYYSGGSKDYGIKNIKSEDGRTRIVILGEFWSTKMDAYCTFGLDDMVKLETSTTIMEGKYSKLDDKTVSIIFNTKSYEDIEDIEKSYTNKDIEIIAKCEVIDDKTLYLEYEDDGKQYKFKFINYVRKYDLNWANYYEWFMEKYEGDRNELIDGMVTNKYNGKKVKVNLSNVNDFSSTMKWNRYNKNGIYMEYPADFEVEYNKNDKKITLTGIATGKAPIYLNDDEIINPCMKIEIYKEEEIKRDSYIYNNLISNFNGSNSIDYLPMNWICLNSNNDLKDENGDYVYRYIVFVDDGEETIKIRKVYIYRDMFFSYKIENMIAHFKECFEF